MKAEETRSHAFISRPGAQPFAIERAEGAYLITPDGRRILDAAGGAIVSNIGHGRDLSYHGATLATLGIGGHQKRWASFEPWLPELPKAPACFCAHCPLDKSYPSCALACAEEIDRLIEKSGPDRKTRTPLPRQVGLTGKVVAAGLEFGAFFYPEDSGAAPDVIMLGPAFTIGEPEIELLADTLERAISSAVERVQWGLRR